MNLFSLFYTLSNTRKRTSLQALLHAATFCRRMEKIYLKMDPLQPSPSEEALLEKIRSSCLNEQITGVPGKQPPKQKSSKNEDGIGSSKWKKAREKVAPNSDYGFMKSFSIMFSQLSTKPTKLKNANNLKLKRFVLSNLDNENR